MMYDEEMGPLGKKLKNSKKNIDIRAKMALLGQSVSPSETAARTQSERNDHAAL